MRNIKALRKKSGFSQTEVGNAIGVGQSTVAMWENGTNKPRADMLIALAKLYGCTIEELLDDHEPVRAAE